MRWINDRLGGQNTKSFFLIGGEKWLQDGPSDVCMCLVYRINSYSGVVSKYPPGTGMYVTVLVPVSIF
jgi:hypothetical protein